MQRAEATEAKRAHREEKEEGELSAVERSRGDADGCLMMQDRTTGQDGLHMGYG